MSSKPALAAEQDPVTNKKKIESLLHGITHKLPITHLSLGKWLSFQHSTTQGYKNLIQHSSCFSFSNIL